MIGKGSKIWEVEVDLSKALYRGKYWVVAPNVERAAKIGKQLGAKEDEGRATVVGVFLKGTVDG